MKTLKQLLSEAEREPFKSTGTPGSRNWSVGADLAKNWATDPEYKKKLTHHVPAGYDDLLKQISQQLGPEAFVRMSPDEMDQFEKKLSQVIDASIWKAKQKQSQEPSTNPMGSPPEPSNPGKGSTKPG